MNLLNEMFVLANTNILKTSVTVHDTIYIYNILIAVEKHCFQEIHIEKD